MPVSVMEAMACGLLVVVPMSSSPYLLEHGNTALLVPPRDPTEMARAVDQLLGNDALASSSPSALASTLSLTTGLRLDRWGAYSRG